MPEVVLHREELKAAIRIRCGSIAAFARSRGMKPQAVRDLFRGKSGAAKPAVAKLLGIEADQLVISRDSTDVERYTSAAPAPHRINAEAR